jgi:hypothetical protein
MFNIKTFRQVIANHFTLIPVNVFRLKMVYLMYWCYCRVMLVMVMCYDRLM